MDIIIKDLKKNDEISLTVEPADTIRSVKRQLKLINGVSAQKMTLIYDKKVREDHISLDQLEIEANSTLHMIINPHEESDDDS
jgi:hypothetical protein